MEATKKEGNAPEKGQKSAFYVYDERLHGYHKLLQPQTDNEADIIHASRCPEIPDRISSIYKYL